MAGCPVTLVVLGFGLLYLLLLGLRVAAVWSQRRESVAEEGSRSQGGLRDLGQVTILVPILSGDPRLSQTLEHNLLALPRSRFLWLVDRDDGEGQAVAGDLLARHPGAPISLLVFDPAPAGVNPKTYKLHGALETVETPILLVLDDDTELTALGLNTLIEDLDKGELATVLPSPLPGGGLWTRLLARFIGDNASLTYLGLRPLVPTLTINGMGYALRTEVLRSWGGFSSLLNHLTDDLAVATLVRSRGGRLIQSTAGVRVGTTLGSGQRYLRQMHRWFLFGTLLVQKQSPRVLLALLGFQALPPFLLLAMLLLALVSLSPLALLAAAGILLSREGLLHLSRTPGQDLGAVDRLLSMASELLQPFHLLHALLNRTITWRSHRYRVVENDDFRPL